MPAKKQDRLDAILHDLRSSTYTDTGKEILPRGSRSSYGNTDGRFTSRDDLYGALERSLRLRARYRNMGGMPIEKAVRDLKGLFGGGKS